MVKATYWTPYWLNEISDQNMIKNIQPGIFSQVVLLYQHVKYTTIGWFPKEKTKLFGALVQWFSRIIGPIWTLNQGRKKSRNHVKECTLNQQFFAGSFMKKHGSLKILKNQELEVLLFLKIKRNQYMSYYQRTAQHHKYPHNSKGLFSGLVVYAWAYSASRLLLFKDSRKIHRLECARY